MRPGLGNRCQDCGRLVSEHPIEPDFECGDCGAASCVPLGPFKHFDDCPHYGGFQGEPVPVPQFCGSCLYYENEACRRFPPARVYTGPKPTDLNVTVWPVVRPTIDWCGEHARVSTRR